jgi:preprotein translocase subunit SecA
VPYSLSEVPEEKILEQRKRYAEYKKIEFTNMLNYYQNMGASDSKYLLGPNGIQPHTNIQEDDAGQDAIWKAERDRQKAIQDEAREFKERFQGAQRNEKCRCGSNVKYKKCCLPKVNTIK